MKKTVIILGVALFALGACGSSETKSTGEESIYENKEHEQEALDLMEEMNAKANEEGSALDATVEETDSIIDEEGIIID